MTLRERILSRLDQMQKTVDEAPAGPWESLPADGRGGYRVFGARDPDGTRVIISNWAGAYAAALLVESRSAMPLLIAALREEVEHHEPYGFGPDDPHNVCEVCTQYVSGPAQWPCAALRRIASHLFPGGVDVEKEG